ncbi:MAG: hypothetical protein ACI9KE_000957 [Polyangiales bacterium]|jgi:hypothetical protein
MLRKTGSLPRRTSRASSRPSTRHVQTHGARGHSTSTFCASPAKTRTASSCFARGTPKMRHGSLTRSRLSQTTFDLATRTSLRLRRKLSLSGSVTMRPALIEAQANASPSARARKDQGTTRNVEPEAVNEAIQQALPSFHGQPPSVAAVYRVCIERELLAPDHLSPYHPCTRAPQAGV